MLRKGCFKYMVYSGYETQDILFDLVQDPQEKRNVIDQYPQVAKEFRRYFAEGDLFAEIEENQRNRALAVSWMTAWEKQVGIDDSERWSSNPDSAKDYPVVQ